MIFFLMLGYVAYYILFKNIRYIHIVVLKMEFYNI